MIVTTNYSLQFVLTILLLDLLEPPVGVKELLFCTLLGGILPEPCTGGAPPKGIIVVLLLEK